MSKAQSFVTPKGELVWVFIDGKGKKDLNGNDRYTASLRLKNDSKELKEITKLIDTFWEDHKPKGKKGYKSNGIREEFKKDDEGVEQETGYHLVNFWTGISFPDGSDKVIKIFRAKKMGGQIVQAEVNLGSKKIGNGSTGYISGAMDIYDQGGKNCGVTLYLNGIQLVKLVEFTGTMVLATPDEDDIDDSWGDDIESTEEEEKPKLDL